MHLCQALAPDCWGALDFIDGEGKPIEKKLTIRAAYRAKPPAGGKEKLCLEFEGDSRKCFLSNGEVKKVANILRRYETDLWKGAVLLMTAGEKKFAGSPVMGMVVKNAAFRQKPEASNVQP